MNYFFLFIFRFNNKIMISAHYMHNIFIKSNKSNLRFVVYNNYECIAKCYISVIRIMALT